MAWGTPEPASTAAAPGAKGESLFLKIEDGQTATVRIITEEPLSRLVHKIRVNGRIKSYVNCPGGAVCPICKLPKSAKDPKAPTTILSQKRYLVPVLNRTLKKVQLWDAPKTPKEDIDLMAKSYGDPRNYDIMLTRIGINTKPMMGPQQTPITPEEVEVVNTFLKTVDFASYVKPATPEEVRQSMDEAHTAFTSGASTPAAPATPQTVTGGQITSAAFAPQAAAPAPVAQTIANPFAAPTAAPVKQPDFKPANNSVDDKLWG